MTVQAALELTSLFYLPFLPTRLGLDMLLQGLGALQNGVLR